MSVQGGGFLGLEGIRENEKKNRFPGLQAIRDIEKAGQEEESYLDERVAEEERRRESERLKSQVLTGRDGQPLEPGPQFLAMEPTVTHQPMSEERRAAFREQQRFDYRRQREQQELDQYQRPAPVPAAPPRPEPPSEFEVGRLEKPRFADRAETYRSLMRDLTGQDITPEQTAEAFQRGFAPITRDGKLIPQVPAQEIQPRLERETSIGAIALPLPNGKWYWQRSSNSEGIVVDPGDYGEFVTDHLQPLWVYQNVIGPDVSKHEAYKAKKGVEEAEIDKLRGQAPFLEYDQKKYRPVEMLPEAEEEKKRLLLVWDWAHQEWTKNPTPENEQRVEEAKAIYARASSGDLPSMRARFEAKHGVGMRDREALSTEPLPQRTPTTPEELAALGERTGKPTMEFLERMGSAAMENVGLYNALREHTGLPYEPPSDEERVKAYETSPKTRAIQDIYSSEIAAEREKKAGEEKLYGRALSPQTSPGVQEIWAQSEGVLGLWDAAESATFDALREQILGKPRGHGWLIDLGPELATAAFTIAVARAATKAGARGGDLLTHSKRQLEKLKGLSPAGIKKTLAKIKNIPRGVKELVSDQAKIKRVMSGKGLVPTEVVSASERAALRAKDTHRQAVRSAVEAEVSGNPARITAARRKLDETKGALDKAESLAGPGERPVSQGAKASLKEAESELLGAQDNIRSATKARDDAADSYRRAATEDREYLRAQKRYDKAVDGGVEAEIAAARASLEEVTSKGSGQKIHKATSDLAAAELDLANAESRLSDVHTRHRAAQTEGATRGRETRLIDPEEVGRQQLEQSIAELEARGTRQALEEAEPLAASRWESEQAKRISQLTQDVERGGGLAEVAHRPSPAGGLGPSPEELKRREKADLNVEIDKRLRHDERLRERELERTRQDERLREREIERRATRQEPEAPAQAPVVEGRQTIEGVKYRSRTDNAREIRGELEAAGHDVDQLYREGHTPLGVGAEVDARIVNIDELPDTPVRQPERVTRATEFLSQGKELTPPLLSVGPDGSYTIVDGVHRIAALKKAGKKRIMVDVHKDPAPTPAAAPTPTGKPATGTPTAPPPAKAAPKVETTPAPATTTKVETRTKKGRLKTEKELQLEAELAPYNEKVKEAKKAKDKAKRALSRANKKGAPDAEVAELKAELTAANRGVIDAERARPKKVVSELRAERTRATKADKKAAAPEVPTGMRAHIPAEGEGAVTPGLTPTPAPKKGVVGRVIAKVKKVLGRDVGGLGESAVAGVKGPREILRDLQKSGVAHQSRYSNKLARGVSALWDPKRKVAYYHGATIDDIADEVAHDIVTKNRLTVPAMPDSLKATLEGKASQRGYSAALHEEGFGLAVGDWASGRAGNEAFNTWFDEYLKVRPDIAQAMNQFRKDARAFINANPESHMDALIAKIGERVQRTVGERAVSAYDMVVSNFWDQFAALETFEKALNEGKLLDPTRSYTTTIRNISGRVSSMANNFLRTGDLYVPDDRSVLRSFGDGLVGLAQKHPDKIYDAYRLRVALSAKNRIGRGIKVPFADAAVDALIAKHPRGSELYKIAEQLGHLYEGPLELLRYAGFKDETIKLLRDLDGFYVSFARQDFAGTGVGKPGMKAPIAKYRKVSKQFRTEVGYQKFLKENPTWRYAGEKGGKHTVELTPGSKAGKIVNPFESLANQTQARIASAWKIIAARQLLEHAEAMGGLTRSGLGQWISKVDPQQVVKKRFGSEEAAMQYVGKNPEFSYVGEVRGQHVAQREAVQTETDEFVQYLEQAGMNLDDQSRRDVTMWVSNLKAYNMNPNVIHLPDKAGNLHAYEIAEPLLEAFQGSHPSTRNLGLKLVQDYASAKRLGATGARPTFAIATNVIRDAQEMIITGSGKTPFHNLGALLRGWGYNVADIPILGRMPNVSRGALPGAAIGGLVGGPVGAAAGAAVGGAVGGARIAKAGRKIPFLKNLFAELDQNLVRLAKAQGMEMTGRLSNETTLKRFVEKLQNQSWKRKPLDIIRHPIDAVRDALSFSDMGPRLGEMEQVARSMGWKPGDPFPFQLTQQTSRAAAEVTLDFLAGGKTNKSLSRVEAFFNVPALSLRKFVRLAKRNPKKFLSAGLSGLTAPAITNWMFNKDDQYWRERKPHELIMWNHVKNGRGGYWKIPKVGGLFSFLFDTLPVMVLDGVYQEYKKGEKGSLNRRGRDSMKALLEELPYPGRVVGSENMADLVQRAVPVSMAQDVLKGATNWDSFTQRRLFPGSLVDKTPAYLQQAYGTTKASSWLSRKLHDNTGGGVDVSPVVLDVLFNGGSGSMYGDTSSFLFGPPPGKQQTFEGPTSYPLLNRVLGPFAARFETREHAGQSYYDLVKEVDGLQKKRNEARLLEAEQFKTKDKRKAARDLGGEKFDFTKKGQRLKLLKEEVGLIRDQLNSISEAGYSKKEREAELRKIQAYVRSVLGRPAAKSKR